MIDPQARPDGLVQLATQHHTALYRQRPPGGRDHVTCHVLDHSPWTGHDDDTFTRAENYFRFFDLREMREFSATVVVKFTMQSV